MRLYNLNSYFDSNPYLTTPIGKDLLRSLPFKDFDKDGYEVPAPIEHLHYKKNNVNLNQEIQYHIAPVKPWYKDLDDSESGLVLDHCMLLCRWAFAGQARDDILEVAQERPILYKLLNIKPKWGIDFSLDYVSHEICTEVIHIEQDFDSLDEAIKAKDKLEQIIETTDWIQGTNELIARKNEWQHLSSDDHSDYKARFFGWTRAFDNKKVFS